MWVVMRDDGEMHFMNGEGFISEWGIYVAFL
jgi:hypothetical protein